MALVDVIRAAIVDSLRDNAGCVAAAAKDLGIGKITVYRKIKEFEIQPWEYHAQLSPPAAPAPAAEQPADEYLAAAYERFRPANQF